jgi:hypothetical protein
MSFAALEVRTNAAVMRRLSNAVATVVLPVAAAGETIDGIFDAAYLLIDAGSGIESSAPVLTLPDASIPAAMATALEQGDAVTLAIGGVTYNVVEHKPDGTGLTLLRLRK